MGQTGNLLFNFTPKTTPQKGMWTLYHVMRSEI